MLIPRLWGFSLVIAVAMTFSAAAQERVVNIYNWSDYIDPKVLDQFTAETGIKVVYDVYDDNKILETKLLAGRTGYDIVVPSAYFLQRQILAGVYQPLDRSKLANEKNLWPALMKRMELYDPGNRYAINLMWGTTGIGVNVDKVKAALGSVPDSWSLVFDPANMAKLQGCGVTMLDAPDDVLPAALNYLGLDPNSKNVDDLQKAADVVAKVRPYIRNFTSSAYIEGLATGDICVAIGWSGDVLQARDRALEAAKGLGTKPINVAYILPKEGGQIWFDSVAIPADAPHPDEAHQFLNFIMRPEIAAQISNYVRYASGNLAAKDRIDPAMINDPTVYPGDQVMNRLYVITMYDNAVTRAMTRMWTRIATQQ
ncbi:MAG: polyamine ABC transporter substrate-binding protein [Mesorhizobium sp.]|uniref:polyamine ABC transporter substrate-binding protein n=1 Tax=unclassified Mesorhizobium TaxID=325217 RepID=UPI000FD53D39|nr:MULTISPECIES: polyamine ABC transporter substrate-binding protein [unclassified Mesorhizobium]RVD43959.1 polyamine ABC transporter substrate-binding protein [Mesorhizobium sp. M4A.F.Ca.ET.020.02.1.1]RWC21750.1 MAG: polyamine ABC transporter substrate-binding protein [Mesorhizobium sp.]RWD04670.1 MAG: polyamine ABC transporter substrate-binding protein [Mesorhizobium sp.]RWD29183.1 MAG: polyamine ABC transporter substrate-binding protein [Mesorhizobium sp.]TIT95293.1 MAG: extracellular solut